MCVCGVICSVLQFHLIVFHPYRSLRSFLSQYQVRAVFQDVHHAECARGPHDSYDCQRVACVSMLAVYHRGWITLLGWRKCRNGPRQTTSVRKQWTWEHCIEGRHAKYLQRLLPIFRCSTRLHRQVIFCASPRTGERLFDCGLRGCRASRSHWERSRW